MEQDIVTTTPHNVIMDYDELSRRRRLLESDITQQEQHVITIARKIITPRNVVKSISGIAFNKALPKTSLISSINNGWQWIKLAARLLKRYL